MVIIMMVFIVKMHSCTLLINFLCLEVLQPTLAYLSVITCLNLGLSSLDDVIYSIRTNKL